MRFGMYKGQPLDDVPLDYLFWLFPRLKNVLKGSEDAKQMYDDIFEWFFTTQNIHMDNRTRFRKGFCFHFKKYVRIGADGNKLPFIKSFWRSKDSEGKYVYEFEAHGSTRYVRRENNLEYHISNDYVSLKHAHGGKTIVYEKNPNFFFCDERGNAIEGAYLMRKPWLPKNMDVADSFKNFPIEQLKR